MFEFFNAIFIGTGFVITVFAVGYGISYLIDEFQKARRKREERYDRLIAAIDQIREDLRDKTNRG